MGTRLPSSAAMLSNKFDGARFAALRTDHLDACSAPSDGPVIRVTYNLLGRAHDATERMRKIALRPSPTRARREPTQSRTRSIAASDRGTEGGFWSG
jgi:hypothetical protein